MRDNKSAATTEGRSCRERPWTAVVAVYDRLCAGGQHKGSKALKMRMAKNSFSWAKKIELVARDRPEERALVHLIS